MKKQILFLLVVAGFMQFAYCNDSMLSKVVFYRENNYAGSLVSYRISDGDSVITRLKNSSFFIYACKSGVHDFLIEKSKAYKLKLNVEPGKTYYLRFDLLMGMWTSVPKLTMVDSVYAFSKIKNANMQKLESLIVPFTRPKNRLGVNLNMGFGLQNTPMVTTNNGTESTVSFGGGIGLGLIYGHEFGKYFDFEFDLCYHSSQLTPTISNGDITFERGLISVTPSFIIPIKEGEIMRFKLGAGPDYYFGPVFNFDLSQMTSGFKDTWNYNSTIGYHISLNYEFNPSSEWSFTYGLKYYKASYVFSKGINSYPTDEKLTRPDASGIDLILGVYYNF